MLQPGVCCIGSLLQLVGDAEDGIEQVARFEQKGAEALQGEHLLAGIRRRAQGVQGPRQFADVVAEGGIDAAARFGQRHPAEPAAGLAFPVGGRERGGPRGAVRGVGGRCCMLVETAFHFVGNAFLDCRHQFPAADGEDEVVVAVGIAAAGPVAVVAIGVGRVERTARGDDQAGDVAEVGAVGGGQGQPGIGVAVERYIGPIAAKKRVDRQLQRRAVVVVVRLQIQRFPGHAAVVGIAVVAGEQWRSPVAEHIGAEQAAGALVVEHCVGDYRVLGPCHPDRQLTVLMGAVEATVAA